MNCDSGARCPKRLGGREVALLDFISQTRRSEDVAFSIGEIVADMARHGRHCDMSAQLISYHVNRYLDLGMFEIAGRSEEDKRRRMFRLTRHGRDCTGCAMALVDGSKKSPLDGKINCILGV